MTVLVPILFALLLTLLLAVRQSRHSRSAPPGPPGYPFIGNVLSMSRPKIWIAFAEWAKIYGPIMSLTVPSHRFIILNTYEAASTLMARHSDRMHLPMAGALVGWGRTTGFLPSGYTLKAHRRLIRIMLSLDVRVEQEQTGMRLVERLRSSSSSRDCIQHAVVSLMLRLIYGYEVKEDNDEYIAIANSALAGLAESATPGAFLVDTLPILRRIPSFCLGINFKCKAKEWRESLEKMATIPFELAKNCNPELETPKSYVSSLIDSEPLELQEEIKWVAVSIYAGAVETTLATLDAFLLAMILNPDVQQQAQRELDEVLSQQTVTLNHRRCLPYMDALCKEVYRFHTVVPTGIGHCAEKDDVYGGFCIQKGDVILANQWSMAHDPDVYRDPFQFDPDRFVKRDERDPRDICFGFGTRTCPGRFFMDSTFFVVATNILSSFNVVPMKDEPPPTWDTIDGMICHVAPFNYLLVPRRTSNESVS